MAGALLSREPGLFLTMHGDLAAAIESGCRGVHYSSADIGRCGASNGFLTGASCHNSAEIEGARAGGADYCFLSPVFAPVSKEVQAPPLGCEGFGRMARPVLMPVLALGGMTPDRAEELKVTGAWGVAVLGDLFLADNIEKRAALWTAVIERVYGSK